MRRFLAVVGIMAMACSGGDGDDASNTAAAQPAPAMSASAPPSSGAVHTVDMVITEQGEYKFVPEELTIKTGDQVRWVNVSGGPHNVQFRLDGIPDGAEPVLAAAMDGRTIGPLNGALMTAPNAVYEISFAGAPAGVYDYTCTPHELLGMNAKLTVEN